MSLTKAADVAAGSLSGLGQGERSFFFLFLQNVHMQPITCQRLTPPNSLIYPIISIRVLQSRLVLEDSLSYKINKRLSWDLYSLVTPCKKLQHKSCISSTSNGCSKLPILVQKLQTPCMPQMPFETSSCFKNVHLVEESLVTTMRAKPDYHDQAVETY